MEFSLKEKRLLFKLARESIEEKLFDKQPTEIDTDKYPTLKSKCGAFVTLTIAGQLRGCIGYITSNNPLYITIKDAAVGAAYGDPRFANLTKTEYEQVDLEISVLSEPFPMNSYDEIELGKHGLILEEKGRRGLLLPQVPIEHGMTKEQYLSAICRKAGVPQDLWQERVLNILLFTATVFSEKDMGIDNASN